MVVQVGGSESGGGMESESGGGPVETESGGWVETESGGGGESVIVQALGVRGLASRSRGRRWTAGRATVVRRRPGAGLRCGGARLTLCTIDRLELVRRCARYSP